MIQEQLTNKSAFAPTPSDSVDFTQCRYGFLYVGGTGTVKVTTLSGDSPTFTAVPAGTVLGGSIPLKIKRVWSTGLTATNMVVMHSE